MMRLGRHPYFWLLGVTLLAGCATAAQRQVQHTADVLQQARSQSKACVLSVINKPEYASLIPHTFDPDTGQATMRQLTDETFPSPNDASLMASRHDEILPCRKQFLTAFASVRPDATPAIIDGLQRQDAVMVLLVEQKITWGSAAQQAQAVNNETRDRLAAIDRQWRSDMNALNEAELSRRQAAANALVDSIQQQQLINAVNKPVQTTCNRIGSTVNCTSY